MTNKKDLWNRVCTTDPKAVKAITGKQYQGNSPRPYWIIERLTEEFGPCGIGWGFSILNERMERLADTEILHVAVVQFWYVLDGQRGELQQIGQTRAVYAKKNGDLMIDEDAPKKSVTDALVKCASYIGFAGDIFSGRWDDSKYVESAAQHYANKRAPAQPTQATGAAKDMSPKARAQRIEDGVKTGDAPGAAAYLATLPQEELDTIWALLKTVTIDQITAAWPETAEA